MTATMLEILELCKALDAVAVDVYRELAENSTDDELRSFWEQMSAEEATHVGFWEQLLSNVHDVRLPELVEDADTVKAELEAILPRVAELLTSSRARPSIARSFMLGYRLEFYLLHPVFELLFHWFGPLSGVANPEADYEQHVTRFAELLARRGQVTPELELLGQTLSGLWRENRKLAHRSTHDSSTGLLNRHGFLVMGAQLWALAKRRAWHVGVLFADIDDFKTINDTHGHRVGDAVIAEAARAFRGALRGSDPVGRFGGEEFVALLPDVRPEALPAIAEKARSAVASSAAGRVPVTVSVGVAAATLRPHSEMTLEALLRIADDCLYTAKRAGKNRVIVAAEA